MPRTRIVCTLGPATSSEDKIRALIRAGMNVARINFSHGTREEHKARIDIIRRISAQENTDIALLGDLSGPKLRVGNIPGGSMPLKSGEIIRFSLDQDLEAGAVPLDFPFLGDTMRAGDRILIDDGTKEVEAISANPSEIMARVITGGELKSRKGVNLPNVALPIPSLTDSDRENALWAITEDFDYLAMSFVRRAADIALLRDLLRENNVRVPIIAKIEKPEAVHDIEAILQESDGVMVARGDLGVEMPAEQVPITQKMIIHKANSLGIPVITATQMLESMIENPRPTRAEASDVANAVLDGSDAVMLSGETAVGKYPIQAVEAMAHIADYTEHFMEQDHVNRPTTLQAGQSVTDAIGEATVNLAYDLGAKVIITLTSSGYSARMVARHRPTIPILAVTVEEKIKRRLALVWGVSCVCVHEHMESERLVEDALSEARRCNLALPGDRVVITAGVPAGISGNTNMVQVRVA
jgi:pyruvate kinase